MDGLRAGTLTIEIAELDGKLILSFTGKSNDHNPDKVLQPYFDRLLPQAEKSGLALELHFERLLHFNSSTIGFLIRLVQDAKQRKIPLTLVYAEHELWQRVSFDALRVFTRQNPYLVLRGLGS
jgi:hypothetical protein